MCRESKKDNDLFFVCSLIDYIGRKTKNERKLVVNSIGKEEMEHIYELADVYHCENIDKVSDELIVKANIEIRNFDNVAQCIYRIPTHWDIGKVYKRLIKMVSNVKNISVIDALFEVYHSFISEKIDDYNSSVYYENPQYIFHSFMEGELLD